MSESIINLLNVSLERARNLLTKGTLAEDPSTMAVDVLGRVWALFTCIRLAVEKAEKAVAARVKALVLAVPETTTDPKSGAESKRLMLGDVEALCSRTPAKRVLDTDAALPVAIEVPGCVTYSLTLTGLSAEQALAIAQDANERGIEAPDAVAHVDEVRLAAACTLNGDFDKRCEAAGAWKLGEPGAWRLTLGKATPAHLRDLGA